jgi:hypothetical protein
MVPVLSRQRGRITMRKSLSLAIWAASVGVAHAVALAPIMGGPVASVTHTSVNAVAAVGAFSGNDTGNVATVQNTLDTLEARFGAQVPGGTAPRETRRIPSSIASSFV